LPKNASQTSPGLPSTSQCLAARPRFRLRVAVFGERKLGLQAGQPPRHDVDLRFRKSFGQSGVQVRHAALRPLARGTSCFRQPQARRPAIGLVRPPFDQPRLFCPVSETAHSWCAQIQRSSGFAHERAVAITQKKQQPRLGCRDAAAGRARLRSVACRRAGAGLRCARCLAILEAGHSTWNQIEEVERFTTQHKRPAPQQRR